MSIEQEIHGKLGHLSRALGVAMQVIEEIERDLSGAGSARPRAEDGGTEARCRGPLDAPVYPRDAGAYAEAVEAAAAADAEAEAAPGGMEPDGPPPGTGPDAMRVSPRWAYLMSPWAWPGAAAMWWTALFGGWPMGAAPPWAPPWGLGHGMPPSPYAAWPQTAPPWWGTYPPVWPTAPWPTAPGRAAPEEPAVDRSGGEAAAAHDRDAAHASAPQDAPPPERSSDPWTWRWASPEERDATDVG